MLPSPNRQPARGVTGSVRSQLYGVASGIVTSRNGSEAFAAASRGETGRIVTGFRVTNPVQPVGGSIGLWKFGAYDKPMPSAWRRPRTRRLHRERSVWRRQQIFDQNIDFGLREGHALGSPEPNPVSPTHRAVEQAVAREEIEP